MPRFSSLLRSGEVMPSDRSNPPRWPAAGGGSHRIGAIPIASSSDAISLVSVNCSCFSAPPNNAPTTLTSCSVSLLFTLRRAPDSLLPCSLLCHATRGASSLLLLASFPAVSQATASSSLVSTTQRNATQRNTDTSSHRLSFLPSAFHSTDPVSLSLSISLSLIEGPCQDPDPASLVIVQVRLQPWYPPTE